MANKTVQPVVIALDIKGADKVPQLKGLFRDLSKTFKVTDKDIESVVEGINEYVQSASKSEAVIKGQIKAFEGLREQAKRGGRLYSELSSDIAELKAGLDGSSAAIESQRKALLEIGKSSKSSASEIREAIRSLKDLSKEAVKDSEAFIRLKKDTRELVEALAALEEQSKKQRQLSNLLNGTLRKSATLISLQAKAYQDRVKQTEQQIVAIELLSSAEQKQAKNVERRARLEQQLQSQLSKAAETGYLDFVASSRRETIKLAEVFNNADESIRSFNKRLGLLDKDFGKLPNTAAGVKQRIAELQRQLENTEPGRKYANLTVEIANKQRELQQILTGTADAYDKVAAAQDRSTRVAQKIADIQQYQATTPGRMAPTAGGYRDPETGAMIARGRGQIADRAAYRKRGEAFAEGIASAVESLAAVPALPMAGMTTAPGTGAERSGMARRPLPYVTDPRTGERVLKPGAAEVTFAAPIQSTFDLSLAPAARTRQAGLPSAATGVAPAVGYGEQVIKQQVSALREAVTAYRPYNQAIRDARKASNDSINSINGLKNALIAKRDAVPATSAAFRRLTKEIEDLDQKSERVSRRLGRRRMSPMQMTQAAGAAISGGIFGGPEGFIGGAGGALLGGVGGAFAGAAVGAQVGGIRRTLGEYADYAAQIEKLNIALEGIAGSQDQYNRALAAAANVTKSLNVPQEVAIQGITRLTAAVKGAGGGVADAELAFKNINAAIIATGGGADQVQGAVTALVQIFSKGKVSAEEINQIAERLPGTFNKIAAASGRTGPELTKALQKGQVGLNDLMKFLVSLGDEYGDLSRKIAGSSENAGARLQVAYNNMRIEVGKALQPIGAEFQDAFREFTEDITPAMADLLPKVGNLVLGLAKNLDVLAAAAAAAAVAMGAVAVTGMKFMGFAGLGALLMKAAAGAGALAAALNPYVAIAAGAAALAVHLHKVGKEQERLNRIIDEGQGTSDEMKDVIEELEDSLKKAQNRLKGYAGETKATGKNAIKLKEQVKELKEQLDKVKGTYEITLKIKRETEALMRGDAITEQMKKQGFAQENGRLVQVVSGVKYDIQTGEKFDPKKHGVTDFGKTKPEDEDTTKGIKDISELEADLIIARTKLNEEDLLARKEFIRAEAEIARQLADALPFHSKRAKLATIASNEAKALARVDEEIKRQAEQTVKAVAAQLKERRRIDDELKQSLAARKLELGLITQEEFNQLEIQRERARLQELQRGGFISAEGVEEQMNVFKQLINQTPIDKFVKQAKDSLNDLQTVAVNVAQGIGDAVGNALTNGVNSLIEGTKNAKEVFADFLKSVGQILAQEGAKMIATYIAIGVAKAFAGMFGPKGPDIHSDAVGSVLPNTSSLADAAAATPLRANGGPVNAGRPYMVGERGPELFVPGQSGGIMRNEEMRRLMGRSPAGGGGGAAAMNFTFETTNIGGTEYVSREQLEAAMATTRRQAANDGAKRGMSMTLDKMQNSPRTRSRIGIG